MIVDSGLLFWPTLYIHTYITFIAGSAAHNAKTQTNEQADRWTDRQKQATVRLQTTNYSIATTIPLRKTDRNT